MSEATSEFTLVELHSLLKHGDIVACKPLPWGSNYTFALALSLDGVIERLAIYKPKKGEAPLYDFPGGTLYKREYAAYLVSQALGWPHIPPTVIRQGPHGVGSVQLYVEPVSYYPDVKARYKRDLQQFALFDFITNNADRKAGHCLLDAGGTLWGIDHGLTFNVVPKLRTVIWDFAGKPIPEELLDSLRSFRANTELVRHLCEALAPLLQDEEIEAYLKRVDQVIEAPVFPLLSAYRNVPWPPF